MTSGWLQDGFRMTSQMKRAFSKHSESTQKALRRHSESTQREREQSDFVISSEPKIQGDPKD